MKEYITGVGKLPRVFYFWFVWVQKVTFKDIVIKVPVFIDVLVYMEYMYMNIKSLL